MNSTIISTTFTFKGHDTRIIEIDGEPRWVVTDICKALDIKNSRSAISKLDDDEKGVVITDTLGGKQPLLYVNESGLYELIFTSRKPEAKAFKRWIKQEVLPAIRKTGSYTIPSLAIEEAQMKEVDDRIEQIRNLLQGRGLDDTDRACASITLQRLAQLAERLDILINKVQATYKKQKPSISTPDFETLRTLLKRVERQVKHLEQELELEEAADEALTQLFETWDEQRAALRGQQTTLLLSSGNQGTAQ